MFQHFIGRVYLFHGPPEKRLPFVDFPLFTQSDSAPVSLLIQIDDEDLSKKAKVRVENIRRQQELPLSVLRENSSIDPETQIALAREIAGSPARMSRNLAWTRFPSWEQLLFACNLIWKHFVGNRGRKATVASGEQLAFKSDRLREKMSVAEQVRQELVPGEYAAKDANAAVEGVLGFERTWATFEFPRYLMALSRIQGSVLRRLGFPAGDYSVFAAQVECLFRNAVVAALDEYGIPLQVAEKIQPALGAGDDLDTALDGLRRVNVRSLGLSPFECELVADAQKAL